MFAGAEKLADLRFQEDYAARHAPAPARAGNWVHKLPAIPAATGMAGGALINPHTPQAAYEDSSLLMRMP